MPARKITIRLLLSLLIAGAAAAVVYGFCALIVLQVGARSPDPASGQVFLYEISGRGGRTSNYYVTRTFHLISDMSGYIAAICLGLPLAAGLCFLIGETARLMIPARYERANTELSRYRKSVGTAAVTAEGLRYVSAWRDFHRRTSLMLSLIVVVIVVVLLGARSDWGVALILGSLCSAGFGAPVATGVPMPALRTAIPWQAAHASSACIVRQLRSAAGFATDRNGGSKRHRMDEVELENGLVCNHPTNVEDEPEGMRRPNAISSKAKD